MLVHVMLKLRIKVQVQLEKVSFTSVYGYYKFDGALKGLKLGAEFEDKGKDKDGQDYLWIICT